MPGNLAFFFGLQSLQAPNVKHVAQLGSMIQLKDTVQNKYLGTRMHHYRGHRDAQAAGALEVDREKKPCKPAR